MLHISMLDSVFSTKLIVLPYETKLLQTESSSVIIGTEALGCRGFELRQ
jgi:hypothetical protein